MSTIVKLGVPVRDSQQHEQAKVLGVAPDPVYGDHLQTLGIKGLPSEATPHFRYSEIHGEFKDGTKLYPAETAFGNHPAELRCIRPRYSVFCTVAPPLLGMGLLESIPETDILANADPDDRNGDGISGKPNTVWDIAKPANRVRTL